MPDEPVNGDAFGELLVHELRTGEEYEVIERDDGFISAAPARRYLNPPDAWPALDVAAVERCTGRVLDVGAGAGRAALVLQDQGLGVLALDVSPAAAQACRERGVRDTFTGTVHDLAATQPAGFDTFLLLGNNLGLLGTAQTAPAFLAALAALANPGAQVVANGTDPYGTDDPAHLRYHQRNRAAGRMAGQLTLRVRFRDLITDWFDYLFLSLPELEQILAPSPWRADEIVSGGDRGTGAGYLAVLTLR